MANAIPTTAGLPDNPPAPVIEAICARFREAGVMLFEDILSGAHVERLLDAYAARYARYHRDVDHRDARRVGDARHMITIGVSGAFNDPAVYAPPPVMPVVRGLLGEDAILGSFVAVTSLPGSADQEAHLDTPPLFGTGTAGAEMPPHCLTLVIPLVEMNARHGTTAFFPGTDALGAGTLPARDPVRPVVCAGSAVLFDSRVWHFGTANRSDAPRPVLYNSYHRPWFRDSVNFGQQRPLDIGDEELARVPDAQRVLFAWTRGPGV